MVIVTDTYSLVPVLLALGAMVTGAVYWVLCRRRYRGNDLDSTAFLLVGVAWMSIGLVFEHASLGSFGSVLVLSGMGIALYRQMAAE